MKYQEQHLIPYAAGGLPAGPWLVFAPHPDDEVFGMGGALACAAEADVRVEIVIITAGDRAGDAVTRRAESELAGQLLGVSRLHFWGLPDRRLVDVPLPVKKLKMLLETLQPATVFLPGLQEFHPDHRAATMRLSSLLVEMGYLGRLWLYEVSRQNEANRLLDISEVMVKKLAAIRCFASQLPGNRYEEMVTGINRARTYTLPSGVVFAEAFFEVSGTARESIPLALLTATSRYFHFWPDKDVQADNVGMAKPESAKEVPAIYPSQLNGSLVSILIRSMGRSSLQRTLTSVAAQSWQNIEVLLVNALGKEHPQVAETCGHFPVRWVDSHTALSRSQAANRALDQARGVFLMFLDDDDILFPDHVAKLASRLMQEPKDVVLVHTAVQAVTTEGQIVSTFDLAPPLARLKLGNYIPIHAALFRARCVRENGCRVDESFDIYEDWDFWHNLLQHGDFVFVPGVSALYLIQFDREHQVHQHDFMYAAAGKIYKKWKESWSADDFHQLCKYVYALENRKLMLEEQQYELEEKIVLQEQQAKEVQKLLSQEKEHYRQLCEALQGSLSWRITGPLRQIKLFLSRFLGS